MTEPRQIAVVREYSEIMEAGREAGRSRAIELNISRTEIDRLCGFTPGYSAKILGPVPLRNLSPDSFSRLLQGLGLAVAIIVDPNAAAFDKQIAKVPKRKHRMPTLPRDEIVEIRFTRRNSRKFGRIGGKRRAEKLTAKQLSRIGKRAAAARWRRTRRAKALARARARELKAAADGQQPV